MENIRVDIQLDDADREKLAEIAKAAQALADALTAFVGDDRSET